jgi:probable HAF family extracellular repeat protein
LIGPTSTAIDINNNGQVVGYNGTQGYVWQLGSATPNFLGVLPGAQGPNAQTSARSNAVGINSNGQIIGWSDSSHGTTGFTYSNGTMQDLAVLGGLSTSYISAAAINSNGDIVGWGNVPGGHFLYSSSQQTMINVAVNVPSAFYGINDSGQIVGKSGLSGQGGQAILVDGGTVHYLGTLGGAYSVATGINSNGLVIGTSYTSGTDSFSQHAFLYDGAMRDLGTLGGKYSFVGDINESGVVVGTSKLANGLFHGFIYSNGQMQDLNDLVDPASGIVISDVRGINDKGQIVGIGTKNGNVFNAFVLSPVPEPEAYAMMLAGLLFIGVAKRRHGNNYKNHQT